MCCTVTISITTWSLEILVSATAQPPQQPSMLTICNPSAVMFAQMDTNNDNLIDYNDFSAVMVGDSHMEQLEPVPRVEVIDLHARLEHGTANARGAVFAGSTKDLSTLTAEELARFIRLQELKSALHEKLMRAQPLGDGKSKRQDGKYLMRAFRLMDARQVLLARYYYY
jgi:hypothetical protein